MADGWPVTCSECGADRAGVPENEPCPECGGGARVIAMASTAVATATALRPGLQIGFNDQRPWQELWRSALSWRDHLERSATGANDGEDLDWHKIPIEFCKDCWHLKDHLKHDPAVPESVQGQVEARANNRAKDGPSTRDAGDVANTQAVLLCHAVDNGSKDHSCTILRESELID